LISITLLTLYYIIMQFNCTRRKTTSDEFFLNGFRSIIMIVYNYCYIQISQTEKTAYEWAYTVYCTHTLHTIYIYTYIYMTYILMTYILYSYIPTTGTLRTRFEILLLLYIYTQCVNIIRYIGFFFFIETTLYCKHNSIITVNIPRYGNINTIIHHYLSEAYCTTYTYVIKYVQCYTCMY
jgi:hypothetical protein